jgi:hypothetical protein
MADKKISALTSSTTPLAGSEVLPIVQSGATVKVSIDNITAGKAVSAASLNVTANDVTLINNKAIKGFLLDNSGAFTLISRGTDNRVTIDPDGFGVWLGYNNEVGIKNDNLTVSRGNLVIGTAGKGIDFSANTHAAGMTSELLNDYEEGNWTPVLHRETGGAITASYNTQTGKYVKVGNLVTVSGFVDVASVSAQGSGANEIKGLPYAPANNTLDAGSVSRNNAFTTDVVHSCFGWSDGRILFSSNVNSNAATAVDWKAGFVNFTFSYFV